MVTSDTRPAPPQAITKASAATIPPKIMGGSHGKTEAAACICTIFPVSKELTTHNRANPPPATAPTLGNFLHKTSFI